MKTSAESIHRTKSSHTFFNANNNGVFFRPVIQPKLNVHPANDHYEQEADAMAERVMQKAETSSNTNTFFKPVLPIQLKCASCEGEEKEHSVLRREGTGEIQPVANDVEKYITNLNGTGMPLLNETRNFFEPKFGHDFSNVKVHTDSKANQVAESINAFAFTNGNNIVFSRNQYSPQTPSGQKLLAHELTHVVQQSKGLKSIQKYPGQINCFNPLSSYRSGPQWAARVEYECLPFLGNAIFPRGTTQSTFVIIGSLGANLSEPVVFRALTQAHEQAWSETRRTRFSILRIWPPAAQLCHDYFRGRLQYWLISLLPNSYINVSSTRQPGNNCI